MLVRLGYVLKEKFILIDRTLLELLKAICLRTSVVLQHDSVCAIKVFFYLLVSNLACGIKILDLCTVKS